MSDREQRAARLALCERRLLSAAMKVNGDRDRVFPRLRPEDFYADAHRVIARVIFDLWAERKPVDVLAVHDRLDRTGLLVRVTPAPGSAWEWLVDVDGLAASDRFLADDVDEVENASRTRALSLAASETLGECDPPVGSAAELIERAAGRVSALQLAAASTAYVRTSAEATNAALDAINAKITGAYKPGIRTGLADLDAMVSELKPRTLFILAARPSVGKTALAHQIARHAAAAGFPALFSSLEQSEEELATRAIAATARVDGKRLEEGRKLQPDEVGRVMEAVDHLRDIGLRYDFQASSHTAMHIATTARRLQADGGLKLVVVDYLQLVEPDDPKLNRNEQLDRITRRLRQMARELDVAVLALSQLNRDSEKGDRRPKLSDLRESGAIEQHADGVLLLHRPGIPDGDVDQIELIVAKQRNGPVGLINLAYHRRFLRFENSARGIPQ
jgi:replicative DNA helicase